MLNSDFAASLTPAVPHDATVADAQRLMAQSHLTGLPVIDAAGRVLGIVTEEVCRRVSDWLSVDQVALFHPAPVRRTARIYNFPATSSGRT